MALTIRHHHVDNLAFISGQANSSDIIFCNIQFLTQVTPRLIVIWVRHRNESCFHTTPYLRNLRMYRAFGRTSLIAHLWSHSFGRTQATYGPIVKLNFQCECQLVHVEVTRWSCTKGLTTATFIPLIDHTSIFYLVLTTAIVVLVWFSRLCEHSLLTRQ